MASFVYTAINARGLEVDGVIAANDLGKHANSFCSAAACSRTDLRDGYERLAR